MIAWYSAFCVFYQYILKSSVVDSDLKAEDDCEASEWIVLTFTSPRPRWRDESCKGGGEGDKDWESEGI